MKKISLDKTLQDRIHGPRVDGLILYGKVPEYKAANKSEELELSSAKYIKASETTYNSPRNIRRVFITHSQVVVQYYMPYIVKGKPKNDTWITKSIRDLGLKNIVETIIQNRAYAVNGIGQTLQVELTGTGLSALFNPYVCSNIEEIYFDYTLLVTDINSVIIQSDYSNIYGRLVNNQVSMEQSMLPYELFINAVNRHGNKVDEENIKTRFPRLRTIAFISNLDRILESGKFEKIGRVTSIEECKKTWLIANGNLINASGSLVYYFNLNIYLKNYFDKQGKTFKSDAFNSSLHTDENIYKFDREYLSKLKTKLAQEKEKTRINVNDNASSGTIIKSEKSEKSEEEILLDSITAKDGIEVTTRVLKIAVIGMPRQEVEKLFNSMSTDGQKLYRKLI